MDQSALERRIRALEQKSTPLKGASSGASHAITDDTISLLGELEELAREIKLIREGALVAAMIGWSWPVPANFVEWRS
jgi:hypothetical protein